MSLDRKSQTDPVILPSSKPTVAGLEGSYRVIRLLGRGTMSSVYLAEQISMARPVALKILSSTLSGDPEFVERFMREARASARLNHPNIVAAIDFGEFESRFFLAMEFIDGDPLSAVIERDGAMDEKRVISIGRQVASALEHAAEHGVIHLDVKPANIMICKDGRVKLGDFGLAVILEHPGAAEASRKAVGTPYYMSPEQVEGGKLDWRTDQYSLGASLYEAVTGVKPFQGHSVSDILVKRFFEKPEPAYRVGRRRASRYFSAVLAKMLSRSPDGRYQDFADMVEDFERARAGKKPVYAGMQLISKPNTPNSTSWSSFGYTSVISRVDDMKWRVRWNWFIYSAVLFLLFLLGYGMTNAKALVGPVPYTFIKYDLVAEAEDPPRDIGSAVRENWRGAIELMIEAEKEPNEENLNRAVYSFRMIAANRDFADTAYATAAKRRLVYLESELEKLDGKAAK